MIAAERGVVAMAQDRSDTDAIRFQRTGEPVAASSSRADFDDAAAANSINDLTCFIDQIA